MKKIVFLFLISSLLLNPVAAMSDQAVDLNKLSKAAQDVKNKSEQQTKLQKFTSGVSAVSGNVQAKVKSTFNWVADHIDVILTKNGAIKTLLILGPLFSAYCFFFPPAPVKALWGYIVGSSAQGATEIADATIEALRKNKEKLKSLAVEVMQDVGDVQATIKINQEIGEMQAFFNSLFSLNGGWTIGLGLCKAVDAGIKLGVPFILGLLVKRKLEVK